MKAVDKMRLTVLIAALIAACAATYVSAQQSPPAASAPPASPPPPEAPARPADPFASAASRTKLAVYAPEMPEGFVLGGVQLSSGAPEMLMASWYHSDGRQIHIMQTSPEGLDCPTCETIDINGTPSPFDSYTAEDGDNVVDLTVVRGGTGVLLGLKGKNVAKNDALLVLRKVAESLKKVEAAPAAVKPSDGAAGLAEVAKQASFPLYTPSWLPEYFHLATAAHTPAGLAQEGELGTPEQVIVTYAGPNKSISVVIQPKGAFELSGRVATIGGRRSQIERDQSGVAVKVDCGDAVVVVSGDVAESTLVKLVRSLKKT